MNTIMIKCPCCGAVLTVEDNPSNETKSVRCPICKEKNLYSKFSILKVSGNKNEDRTSIGYSPRADRPGSIFHVEKHQIYDLKEGVNLIGRKTYQSDPLASIPVETDDKGLSRRHIFIEIVKCQDGSVRHYAYNAFNKNRTTVNGLELKNGDKVILHNGDTIRSSRTTLVFKDTEVSPASVDDDDDKTRI